MTAQDPPPAADHLPERSDLARNWRLDPRTVFLNHGSFGACPASVLVHQQELRDHMETEPVRFMVERLEGLLDESRTELARMLGAGRDDLVFVPNATAGVNAVMRSLDLRAGDEVLTTNHEYNACRNVLDFVADRAGARVRVAQVDVPIASEDDVMEAICVGVSDKTRYALISHVTSPTAIVWPIRRIVRELRDRGVETLVDGAHAPGTVELDINDIAPAYYTGNCHKWLCAPKGAGFLWVRPDLQPSVRPAIISHGANSKRTDRSRYQLEFGWTGTDDPTPFVAVGHAIREMGAMVEGGWPEIRRRNHQLALEARCILLKTLGGEPICPDAMLGSMASLRLPDASGEPPVSALYADPLQNRLINEWRVQVPIVPWPAWPNRLVRVSAQLYNAEGEYVRLAKALEAFLG